MAERRIHEFEIMDPDGGGNGSVVTGIGAPRREILTNGRPDFLDVARSMSMIDEGCPNAGNEAALRVPQGGLLKQS